MGFISSITEETTIQLNGLCSKGLKMGFLGKDEIFSVFILIAIKKDISTL